MQSITLANTWGSGLLDQLNEMRLDERMCDLNLLLQDDVTLKAHSCVLAAASPFVYSMLGDSSSRNAEINMKHIPPLIMKQILEFIYSGETTVTKSDLLALHSVAVSLQISVLAELAQKMIHGAAGMPIKLSSLTQVIPNLRATLKIDGNSLIEARDKYDMSLKSKHSNLTGKKIKVEKEVSHTSGRKVGRPRKHALDDEDYIPKKSVKAHQKVVKKSVETKKSISEPATGTRSSGKRRSNMTPVVSIETLLPEKPNHLADDVEEENAMMEGNPSDDGCNDGGELSQCRGEIKQDVNGVNSSVSELNVVDVKRRYYGACLKAQAKVPVHMGATYTCKECSLSFSVEDEYVKHYNRHHSRPKKRQIPCDFCQFSANGRAALENHLLSHTGEKPYTCSYCQKSFKSKYYLQTHKDLHAGKKYPCKICGKLITTKDSLQQHIRFQHERPDYRPYKCPTCNKTFRRSRTMKEHMDNHSTLPKYSCGACDKKFYTQSTHRSHFKRIHKQLSHEECGLDAAMEEEGGELSDGETSGEEEDLL